MSDSRIPGPLSLEGNAAERWKAFLQEFEIYLISSEKSEKKDEVKIALLLHCGGRELLDIFNTLPIEEDDKKKYSKLLDALNLHFEPKKYVTHERYLFNTRVQQPDETFDNFVTDLRKRAKNCNFSTLRDELIRDRIICGIYDENLRGRLLRLEDSTLEEVMKQCRIHEVSEEHMKELAAASNVKVNTAKIKSTKEDTQRNYSRGSEDKPRCKFCGFRHVLRRELCPAADKTCIKCGRRGHFQSRCSYKVSQKPAKKNVRQTYREEDSSESDEGYEKAVSALSICTKDCTHKIHSCRSHRRSADDWVSLKFPDQDVSFKAQVDTGAEVSVLPCSIFNKMKQKPKLLKTKAVLVAFTGQRVKPVGKVEIIGMHNSRKYQFLFYVVDLKCAPLLSKHTSEMIGVVKIIRKLDNEHTSLSNRILTKYADVFTGLGCLEGKVHLDLDSSVTPVAHPPRKVPVAIRDRLKVELDEMERQGVIIKESNPTNWVNSMVVVTKGDKIRVCLDPKDLNKALKRQHYPLPTIEEVSTRLANARVFSVLDATKGFWQISVDDESSKLLTFNTCFGRYRYLRLPFGISPAPEIYQRRMFELFDDLEGVEIIMDDILIYGSTEEEHNARLESVLQRCREKNLKLNQKKLRLKADHVDYIGHTLTKDGLKPDQRKVEVISKFPAPKDKTELLRFMGMINYLAKFVPKMSDVNEPLRRLTEKDADFKWEDEQEKCFNELKRLVTEAPVLRFYDVHKPVTLTVDASAFAVGACILQDDHPVAFAAKSLTKTQRNYAQIEKELLAIVFGAEKFHSYLYGRSNVTVESDHRPLETILKKPLSTAPPRLQRMLLRLQKYSLDVKYKKGKEMYIADALSRVTWPDELETKGEEVEVNLVCVPEGDFVLDFEILREKTKGDTNLQLLKEATLNGWPEVKAQTPKEIHAYWNCRDEISYVNGLLHKMNRIIVPKVLRSRVLKNLHKSHQGIEKSLRLARDLMYWPGMSSELKDVISSCENCSSFSNNQVKEPLMSHDVPELPWQKIGADLFELHGKQYLLLVDYYSKFIECDELETTHASIIVKCCKNHFARHGIPQTLHSDNGPQFSSKEFDRFCKSYGIVHTTSSPCYPKSNGLAEKGVQTVKRLMKKARKDGKDIHLSLLDYRNTPVIGTASPSQLLFGRRTRTTLPTSQYLLQPETQDPITVRSMLLESQEKQKLYYDRSAKELDMLEEGDVVRIKDGLKSETKKAVVIAPRSYLVKDNAGQIYRRNRHHLIKTRDSLPLETTSSYNLGTPMYDKVNSQRDVKVDTPNKGSERKSPLNSDSNTNIEESDVSEDVKLDVTPQIRTSSGRSVRAPRRLDL